MEDFKSMLNIFNTPNEMYQYILDNGHKIVEFPTVIINDDFASTISSPWQKLLYERYVKYGLLDAVVDKSLSKKEVSYPTGSIKVQSEMDYKLVTDIQKYDKLKRSNGVISLLSFDTKWLRNERRVEEKTMHQSVYLDGEIKIKYGFKNNNAKKCIVVFQSNWAFENEIHESENKITHKLTSNLFRHNVYQFYQFAQRNIEFDFIFLEDDYNYIYGWFMTNYGTMIYPNIQRFIRKLKENYAEIHLLGASKGGYGAYHTGKDMEEVDSITAIAPILKVESYWERLNNRHMKAEISNNNIEVLNQIIERENVKPINPKIISVSTGKSDYQYQEIINLTKDCPEVKLLESEPHYNHDEVITMTHKDMLKNSLGLI
jgi:hypothetical protein